MTREKVKFNASLRVWSLEMSPEYATQGQVSVRQFIYFTGHMDIQLNFAEAKASLENGWHWNNQIFTISISLVDQVTGEALEEGRKKQEAVRENIKHLHGELQLVECEIKALEDDLADVIVKRDKAYMRIHELRQQCTHLPFLLLYWPPNLSSGMINFLTVHLEWVNWLHLILFSTGVNGFDSYYCLLNFRTISTTTIRQC